MSSDLLLPRPLQDGLHVEVGAGADDGPDPFQAGAAAARQARAALTLHAPSLVLVFASVRHDLEAALRGVRSVTGDAPLVGASTAGEIAGGERHGSVAVCVIGSPFLRVRLGVGEGVSRDWRGALGRALSAPELAPYFGEGAGAWASLLGSGSGAFALLFSPGNTRHAFSRSFELLEELNRRCLGRLPVFGGGAADDWRLERNFVLAGERAHEDAVVVAVVETELQFGVGMAHGLRSAHDSVTVTAAEGHEVLTLNGRPAADVYAGVLGATRASLAGQHLALATGLLMGTSDGFGGFVPNVASYFTERGGVLFTRPIAPGSPLTLLVPDPELCAHAGLDSVRKAMLRGGIAAPALAVTATCALRPKLLGLLVQDELALAERALGGAPLFGFYGFGEQAPADHGPALHTNTVTAALVLGRELSATARVARENELLRREAEEKAAALERARDGLEQEVAERTRALRELNEALRVEIAEKERAQELARRHLRALRTLTECNEALVRESSEPALLARVCRSVVESGGYRMCWVGFLDQDEERALRPVAQHGADDGYLEAIRVVVADTPLGRGPSGTAVRTREPAVVDDLLEDPAFAPWREEARRRGFRSSAALPLVAGGEVLGTLSIYAGEPRAFAEPAELRLLVDLAHDLAFGITALRARSERDAMAARMMQSDRLAAVGTLAAGVAHEINNPLACVVAGVEFVQERLAAGEAGQGEAELREVLAEVHESGARIRQIVRDLRTFSRGDQEQVEVFDVRSVLDSAVKMTSNETRHRAQVVKRYARELPPVRGNPARLGQVFVNLLINAAHAIPEGRATEHEIRIEAGPGPGGAAVVVVRDSGVGMEPAVLKRAFDPFFTTKPVGIGTGLGLSISRNIVVSLGGDIAVASEPGRGTEFRVTLPPARGSDGPRASPSPGVAPAGPRRTVLVVDDEPGVLRAVERALADAHAVTCEPSAERALRRVQAGERFDVVLCDLMMPELSGMDFRAAVARAAPDQAGRIAFITGGAFTPAAHRLIEEERGQVLEKPFTSSALRAFVASVAAQAERGRG